MYPVVLYLSCNLLPDHPGPTPPPPTRLFEAALRLHGLTVMVRTLYICQPGHRRECTVIAENCECDGFVASPGVASLSGWLVPGMGALTCGCGLLGGGIYVKVGHREGRLEHIVPTDVAFCKRRTTFFFGPLLLAKIDDCLLQIMSY